MNRHPLNQFAVNGGAAVFFADWEGMGSIALAATASALEGASAPWEHLAAPMNGAPLAGHALNHATSRARWMGSAALTLTGVGHFRLEAHFAANAGITLAALGRLNTGVRLGAQATLIFAGHGGLRITPFVLARGQRLADPLSLRDTSVWPGYAVVTILPRVYGRTRVAGIRYAAHNKTYVLADHPLAGVDAVYDDGVAIAGWQHANGADISGHASAFVYLAAPPKGRLSADVRGLSGNPADILNDLYPRNDLQDLAVTCANAGLELGGVLQERQTLRAALQFIVDQIGGAWSAGMPGFAMLFPPAGDAPVWATFGPLDMANAQATCQLSEIVTRLSVQFDWDYAADHARQSLVLIASDAASTHGERPADLVLPWIKTARAALAVAVRWLEWRARPLWTLTWACGIQYCNIPPGSIVEINTRLPVSGRVVVTDVDPGYGRGEVRITAQAPAGPPPRVTLLQAGTAFVAVG